MLRTDDFVAETFEVNWLPALALIETENEYHVFVDVPSIDKDTLAIEHEQDWFASAGESGPASSFRSAESVGADSVERRGYGLWTSTPR